MKRYFRVLTVAGGMLIIMFAAAPAFAQQQGGVLKLSHFDSPASMSILEESTRAARSALQRHRLRSGTARAAADAGGDGADL